MLILSYLLLQEDHKNRRKHRHWHLMVAYS